VALHGIQHRAHANTDAHTCGIANTNAVTYGNANTSANADANTVAASYVVCGSCSLCGSGVSASRWMDQRFRCECGSRRSHLSNRPWRAEDHCSFCQPAALL